MSRLERIVAACGGILLDNGRRALIPGFGHSTRDRSVSLVETDEGRILIHCFSPKDDWCAVRRELAARKLLGREGEATTADTEWSRAAVLQPVEEDRVTRARRIWAESRPIHCTAASAYLRRRAIPEALWRTQALRFHPRMTSLDDRLRRPSLVAAIVDASGALQGVQVTLLSAYGTAKAPVSTPRRVIGKLTGGIVRLNEADGDALLVGEGVETMLSAAETLSLPAWAALTAQNLSAFLAPVHVRRLVIGHDADEAGLRAADLLERRHADRMIVERAAPPEDFNDWNAWRQRLYD